MGFGAHEEPMRLLFRLSAWAARTFEARDAAHARALRPGPSAKLFTRISDALIALAAQPPQAVTVLFARLPSDVASLANVEEAFGSCRNALAAACCVWLPCNATFLAMVEEALGSCRNALAAARLARLPSDAASLANVEEAFGSCRSADAAARCVRLPSNATFLATVEEALGSCRNALAQAAVNALLSDKMLRTIRATTNREATTMEHASSGPARELRHKPLSHSYHVDR